MFDGWLRCKGCSDDFVPPEERDDYTGDGYCAHCHDQGMGRDAEETAARVAAARNFVDTWAELAQFLPNDYDCTMQCAEADALAELFRAFGKGAIADEILSAHAEHDGPDDPHYDNYP
ncbi:hypothetical protein BJP40_06630 [Streptomyces sp. CC53]|uniref:hypothetical protein n=1 Tax=Streptomyces sp. CC53 TaxID=1906740 RepID=UPI0008DCCBA5|nr:hypothetical protein [Streptomyces sp. CC53]OII61197.1 hypothetical protein BJP40_06630 [Streptomyces sp. CC53]